MGKGPMNPKVPKYKVKQLVKISIPREYQYGSSRVEFHNTIQKISKVISDSQIKYQFKYQILGGGTYTFPEDWLSSLKPPYNRRTWLNKESSPSTGNVVAFEGEVYHDGKCYDSAFLSISDCNVSARIHKTDADSLEDFRDKMVLLRYELDLFIDHLNYKCKE